KFAKNTSSYTNWMQLSLNKIQGIKQIVIIGNDAENYMQQLQKSYLPNTLFAIAKQHTSIPLLKDKMPTEGKTAIYVCNDKTCGLPVFSVEDIKN
ncbi:MAG: thioredoxin domain-containing protein, partial [Bacteroidia bacterium]